MRRVLVTGANGFVGRAVCEALPGAGFAVRAAVRDAERLPEVRFVGEEVVTVGEIGPETQWRPALDGVETVIHLAGRVHVLKETFEDPLAEFHGINVLGTEHLSRMAAAAGVRRLVYVSSIGVNGRFTQRSRRFTEQDEPAPHNPYAISKWEAERSLHRVAAETGLEVVILRPPLVYGPGVKANFLRLMRLANSGLPLPFGLVGNSRSLIYVGNLTDAVVACLNHPRAVGETFLVSDGKDVSTPELLRTIGRFLGRRVWLLPLPPKLLKTVGRLTGTFSAVEPLLDSLTVDITKIQRTLDWRPPHTLEKGMEHTAKWFKGKKL